MKKWLRSVKNEGLGLCLPKCSPKCERLVDLLIELHGFEAVGEHLNLKSSQFGNNKLLKEILLLLLMSKGGIKQ